MCKKTYLVYKALQISVPWMTVVEAEDEREALAYAKAHEKEVPWRRGQRSCWDTHWDVIKVEKPVLSPIVAQTLLH